MAAHGSLEPVVLVRVQVGEPGKAGLAARLLFIFLFIFANRMRFAHMTDFVSFAQNSPAFLSSETGRIA